MCCLIKHAKYVCFRLFICLFVIARQMQDRLDIKSVPVTKATATVGDVTFHFWVYGNDNRTRIVEDWGYPEQCLCGCSIS